MSIEEDLRLRLDALRRTGDVHVLWPGIPREARQRAMASIRSVAAHVLGDTAPPPLLAVGDREARAIGIAAFSAGMGPLLGWWIMQDRLEASAAARRILDQHLEHGRLRTEMLRHQASRVARAMHAEGLRPILLKGIHTGTEFFPDPAVRPSSDIDLLVSPAERERAERVLSALGFSLSKSVVADRADWSLPGTSTLRSVELDHAENPWSVDLHVALHRFYFRGTSVDLGDGAFATGRIIELEGEHVHVLDQPYLTAFLALHAGCDLAAVRLIRLLELVLVIRADLETRRLDWQDFATLLAATGAARFVYPALALTEELAPGTVETALLERLALGASRRMLLSLDAVRRAGTGPLDERSFDIKLAWARGWKESTLALSEVALPSYGGGLADTLGQRLSVARWRIARRFRRGPAA